MLAHLHHHLVKLGPQVLRVPAQAVPFAVQRVLLENALNTLLSSSIEDEELDFLEEKWLKVCISDLGLAWCMTLKQGHIVVADANQAYDVLFQGELNDLILIAGRKEDADTLFFQRRLQIEGDTELGLEVKNLLDGFDMSLLPKPALQSIGVLANFVEQGLNSNLQGSVGLANKFKLVP
ncbi:ubiquinone anaerobic biosynthesis accessory factor UbiT [Motilimonas eburnea]|uniref:ubiquinone anaerobic biosynthesis accessory factor UbiT n=1 Tax=Motilimonas eburnea TaxID=1737488 RepID=UPI001E4A5219|nr:SCP2 sterol-binding domain-containing protein [Motilimonas eburnea]MCE2573403.1 SCP2 sterol-binding domain-containing protein [Motilimonas eburnea]